MPRKPGIYRNFKMSVVTVLVLDVRGETTKDVDYTIPSVGNRERTLKYLQNKYNTSMYKIIRIKKMLDSVESYYMSIDKYIKYAEKVERK